MSLTQRKEASKENKISCEGFSVKSLLKNAKVTPPPNVGAFQERPSKPTAFRKFYLRGDFPIALEHDTKGNKIAWKVCVTIYQQLVQFLSLSLFLF